MSDETLKPPEHIRELARRLAAAYISYAMGLSIGHTLKRYISEDRIGDYWIMLAEKVWADMADAGERRSREIQDLMTPNGPIQ